MTKMVPQLLTESDIKNQRKDHISSDDLVGFEAQNRFYEIGSHAGLNETEKHLLIKDKS